MRGGGGDVDDGDDIDVVEVAGLVREKVLDTRGESSASTRRARRAERASLCVGRGTDIVLMIERGDAWLVKGVLRRR